MYIHVENLFFAIMCCHTCGIIKIEMAVLHEFPYVGKRQCRKLDYSLIRYETLLSRPKTFVGNVYCLSNKAKQSKVKRKKWKLFVISLILNMITEEIFY